MRISLTIEESAERGVWGEIAELRGLNPYALREGRYEGDKIIAFDEAEARTLGLLGPRECPRCGATLRRGDG